MKTKQTNKFFFINLVLLLSFLFFSNFSNSSTVYICASSTASKYHYNKNCRGLSNCQHEIKAVTIEEAKKFGRTLCGWED